MAFVCAVPGVSFEDGGGVYLFWRVARCWLWVCEFVAFGLLVVAWYLGVWLVLNGAVVGCCEFRVWLDWFPVYFGFVELL